ncbi:dynamin family protein [Streptomyces sp. NPDC052236]|uniref:dynamin family protein n=1 Tax=Streptomyces sp. NPDC052236 TaxID=3365686 RepID=UPI0037D04925
MSDRNGLMADSSRDGGGRLESARATDAVELIEQVVELLSQANELELSWSGHVEGESGSIAAMRQELEAVRGGELRMSVVAPMKAGKSTLVNSIVGYELLPARAAAMTTLPTRIVLDRRASDTEMVDQNGDAFRPVLELREQDAAQFDMLVKALRRHLSQSESDGISDQYPHLAPLIQDIRAGRVPGVRQQYQGRAEVQESLTLLNDLVRLAGRVLPAEWRVELTDVPVVRTPYWSPEATEEGGPGRLVVVDTPGPDEHELSEMLGNVVSKQLSESHIVLVVLDYTKMGGQSDAQIRELMKPLLRMIGPEKLFAVVNKIDQKRHETDLDNEGIVRSVTANLGLTDATAQDRIFTTSAEWALASVRTLAALRRHSESFVPAQDDSAARLLKLVYPMDWQEELEGIGAGRLARVAQRAWEFSRMRDFLASAIAWLRIGALRLAIDAALDKAAAELADLENATASRRDLIGRESQDLARAAQQISGELKAIGGFRDQVTAPTELADSLSGALRKQLKNARGEGERVVKRFRDEMKADARASGGANRLAAFASIFQKGEGVFEFSTREAAEDYIRLQTFRPKGHLDAILERTRKQVESSVGASAERQVRRESELVRPIVERAAARVKDEFDITFVVPDWELQGPGVSEVPVLPEAETRQTSQEVEQEFHQRSWRRLWLWKSTYNRSITEVTEEQTYMVRADALADSLQQSFHDCVDEIEGALRGHVREMIVAQVTRYYDKVEAYLQRYRGILQQSAEDNKLQGQKQIDLRETLNVFHTRVQALQGEVEHLRAV